DGPRLDDLGRDRFRVTALHLRDPRADAVAWEPAADEDDEPVEPRDAVPAVRERVDPELDLLVACDRRRGHPPRLTNAEQVEARLEARDLDGDARIRRPLLARQPKLQLPDRDTSRRRLALARRLVAELGRDTRGRLVAGERARRGEAEAEEEQREDRAAHLGPDAAALEAHPEPRPGLGDARLGQLRTLRPGELAAELHAEQQVPRIGAPALALLEMECDEAVDEVRLADRIGPRMEERHLLRRVDALLREVRELDELVDRRQAELQPLRPQPQVEERRDV